jgi:hypothetical protein
MRREEHCYRLVVETRPALISVGAKSIKAIFISTRVFGRLPRDIGTRSSCLMYLLPVLILLGTALYYSKKLFDDSKKSQQAPDKGDRHFLHNTKRDTVTHPSIRYPPNYTPITEDDLNLLVSYGDAETYILPSLDIYFRFSKEKKTEMTSQISDIICPSNNHFIPVSSNEHRFDIHPNQKQLLLTAIHQVCGDGLKFPPKKVNTEIPAISDIDYDRTLNQIKFMFKSAVHVIRLHAMDKIFINNIQVTTLDGTIIQGLNPSSGLIIEEQLEKICREIVDYILNSLRDTDDFYGLIV